MAKPRNIIFGLALILAITTEAIAAQPNVAFFVIQRKPASVKKLNRKPGSEDLPPCRVEVLDKRQSGEYRVTTHYYPLSSKSECETFAQNQANKGTGASILSRRITAEWRGK